MELDTRGHSAITLAITMGFALATAQLLPDVLLPEGGVVVRSLLAGVAAAVVAACVLWVSGKIRS